MDDFVHTYPLEGSSIEGHSTSLDSQIHLFLNGICLMIKWHMHIFQEKKKVGYVKKVPLLDKLLYKGGLKVLKILDEI